MEEHLEDGPVVTTAPSPQSPIDPLRRVFVPIEKRTEKGTLVFRTTDKELYFRAPDGSIRRAQPKVHGKDARKMRRMKFLLRTGK